MQKARVVNVNKGTVVAEQAELAFSFGARLRGLLGRRGLAEGAGMVIRPTDMIHTFFMGFPIDVIFLDDHNRVLKTIENMRPNRVSSLVRQGKTVVELPVGVIARTHVETGDELQIS